MLTFKEQIFLLTLVISVFFWGFSEEHSTDGTFSIISSKADAKYLPEVFAILQEAKRELEQSWGLNIPEQVTVVIHPTLSSFIEASQMPWYIAGVANVQTNQIDLQRLKVLLERNILKLTLRHEVFHLAQSDDLPRWLAEGMAMHFAGDRLLAPPIEDISEEALNNLLANPTSQNALYRSRATAFIWSKPYLSKINSN